MSRSAALVEAAAGLANAARKVEHLLDGVAGFKGDAFTISLKTEGGRTQVTVDQDAWVRDAAPAPTPVQVVRPDPDILAEPQVLALVAACILFWVLLHFLMPVPARGVPAGPHRTYWRRLLRSQLYYIGAAVAGPQLLLECSTPVELLYRFTRWHQVGFATCIAHWVVATVEDFRAKSLLTQGLEKMPILGLKAKDFIHKAYFVHHLMTIGIVSYSLVTHTLAALPILGMIFEVPVVLMNLREFLYTFRDALRLHRPSPWCVAAHWVLTFALFIPARGGASALWIWSLLYWQPMLATLPPRAWCIYNVVAAAFTLLNLNLIRLLLFWMTEDLTAATTNVKEASRNGHAIGHKEAANCFADAMEVGSLEGGVQEMPQRSRHSMPAPQHASSKEHVQVTSNDSSDDSDKEYGSTEVVEPVDTPEGYRLLSFYDASGQLDFAMFRLTVYSTMTGWLFTSEWWCGTFAEDREHRFFISMWTLMVGGIIAAALSWKSGKWSEVSSGLCSPATHLAAACLVLGVTAAHECSRCEGPQLLNAASLLLFLEQLVARRAFIAIEDLLPLAACMWLFDWAWHLVPVLSVALMVLMRAIARMPCLGPSRATVSLTLVVAAGIYSTCLQYAALREVALPSERWLALSIFLAAQVLCLSTECMVFHTLKMSPSMAPRVLSTIVLLGHCGKLPIFLTGFLHLRRINLDLRLVLDQPGAPIYLLSMQESFDYFRVIVFGFVWRFGTTLLRTLINSGLPKELQVYAFPTPYFNPGPEVDLGICAIVEGAKDMKPENFVANVGHIDCAYKGWFTDILRTAESSLGIMREFGASDKEHVGLSSNILCFFPNFASSAWKIHPSSFREFNFSAWKSAKHAHDWYVRSPDHRRIMKAHATGGLRVFGNVLTSLEPARPLRWQARCSKCAGIVEGYPEVKECSSCGAAVIDMPLF